MGRSTIATLLRAGATIGAVLATAPALAERHSLPSGLPSGLPIDATDVIPILEEDFSTGLNRYDGQTGLWSTQSPRGGLMTNAEESVFLDPEAPDVPWSMVPPTLVVTEDGLSIRAHALTEAALDPVRARMRATGAGQRAGQVRYATGRITTVETWAQTYGWFEIEAQIPRGQGRWPAFWLLFAGPGWPPEIDIFEAYGSGFAAPTPKDGRFNTAVFFDALDETRRPVHEVAITNPHDGDAEPRAREQGGGQVYRFTRAHYTDQMGADLYDRVNTYAALWTPEEIIFYFGPDRDSLREIYRTPTPEDAHDPMFLIANDQFTARGGIWPADPDIEAVLDPANDFLIRSIRAYALVPPLAIDMAAGDSAYNPQSSRIRDTSGDDVIAPGAGFDLVMLSGGADEIRVSRGREGTVIEGFGSDDRLVIEGFPFASSAEAHARLTQVGPDLWLSSGADPFWPQSIILRDTRLADVTPDQITSRWPVGRDIWATRRDLPNRSLTDTDGDGVLTAPPIGGFLSDQGGPLRIEGGPGPERYLVLHASTRILEPEEGGADTMVAWGVHALPAHVERGILRGEGGRLGGSPGEDRLEAEGQGGQLSGVGGDDLYVIAPGARDILIRIEDAPGHDRLRGFNPDHDLLLAPTLRARRDGWVADETDEGLLITFGPDQSLLIEDTGSEALTGLLGLE